MSVPFKTVRDRVDLDFLLCFLFETLLQNTQIIKSRKQHLRKKNKRQLKSGLLLLLEHDWGL